MKRKYICKYISRQLYLSISPVTFLLYNITEVSDKCSQYKRIHTGKEKKASK